MNRQNEAPERKSKRQFLIVILCLAAGLAALFAFGVIDPENPTSWIVITDPSDPSAQEVVTEVSTEAPTEPEPAVTTEAEETEETEDPNVVGDHEGAAYVIASEMVKGGLKAPRTAKVSKSWECEYARRDRLYCVKGYVDAENEFGAMLRNEFLVQFYLLDETDYTYAPAYLQIGNQKAGEFVPMD